MGAFSPKGSSSDMQNDLYRSRSMTDLKTSPAPNYKVIRSFSPPPQPPPAASSVGEYRASYPVVAARRIKLFSYSMARAHI